MSAFSELLSEMNSSSVAQSLLNSLSSNTWFIIDFLYKYRVVGLSVFVSILLILALYYALKTLLQYFAMKQNYSILEVKPLQETLQSSYSTQQLFTLIHGLAQQTSRLERFFNVSAPYSFEIVGTKKTGIRYLLRVPTTEAELLKKNLYSYLPGMAVQEVDDYLATTDNARIAELRLNNNFVFPLKRLSTLTHYDPMAYITGNMTKLRSDELVAMQLVLTPAHKPQLSEVQRVSQLLRGNKDILSSMQSETALPLLRKIAEIVIQLLLLPLGVFVFVLSGGRQGPLLDMATANPKEKTLNPYQAELEEMIKDKLDQQLFFSSIRLMVCATDTSSAAKRKKGLLSALAAFGNANYQAIKQARYWQFKFLQPVVQFFYAHRLLNPFTTSVLSVSEVADLYHFPFTKVTKTEDIQKVHSKELSAPLSLKKGDKKIFTLPIITMEVVLPRLA